VGVGGLGQGLVGNKIICLIKNLYLLPDFAGMSQQKMFYFFFKISQHMFNDAKQEQ